MSTALYWKEIPKEQEENNINGLKWILSERIWDTDGSTGQGETKVSKELIPFLEGIIATEDTKLRYDAQALLNAIKAHETVLLYSHG